MLRSGWEQEEEEQDEESKPISICEFPRSAFLYHLTIATLRKIINSDYVDDASEHFALPRLVVVARNGKKSLRHNRLTLK